jgi:hypothetical protein
VINHVRTLLLNRAGTASYPLGYPGEEYVPADYRRRVLPQELEDLSRLLFGTGPDRACLNLWLARYTYMLHSLPELSSWMVESDTRITYLPPSNDLFDWLLSGPRVTNLVNTKSMAILGHWNETSSDRLYRRWVLTVTGATTLEASYTDDLGVPQVTVLNFTPSGGVGTTSLPGTSLTTLFEATVGASWNVEWLARPTDGLADRALLVADSLPDNVETLLFGTAAYEPYKTFMSLWRSHPDRLCRLGGVLLALAWRTEAL